MHLSVFVHAGMTDDLSMRVLCFDMYTNHFLDRIMLDLFV